MPIPIIIPILGSLLAAGAQYAKGKKQEKFTKEEKEKANREIWRNALQRAVGSKLQFKPQYNEEPPSTQTEDILSAIGNIVGQAGARSYATSKYPLTESERIAKLYKGGKSPMPIPGTTYGKSNIGVSDYYGLT